MTVKSANSWIENVVVAIASIVAVIVALEMDEAGMPHKWHTAIFGTIVPFTTVILLRTASWNRKEFWFSLWLLLTSHVLLICMLFGIALQHINVLGLLWWVPIAFAEVFAIINLQRRIERWLRVNQKKIG